MLSYSKRLTQVPDPFLPLWSQLKSALGPAGSRSSPPWSWCITASTITPPCQLLNSHTFFILTNRFLPLWNQRKRAGGPAGNRSSPFRLRAPQHHSDFSVLPNHPFLSLLSQLTLLFLLTLGIDSRSVGFENHSLDHYTTMAKCHGGVVVVLWCSKLKDEDQVALLRWFQIGRHRLGRMKKVWLFGNCHGVRACGVRSPRGRGSIPSWATSTFKLVSEWKKKMRNL